MESVIRQLFNIEGEPFNSVNLSDEESRLLDEVVRLESELLKKFDESNELRELYEKANDAELDYRSECEYSCFAAGLKFGFRLAIEIMQEKV